MNGGQPEPGDQEAVEGAGGEAHDQAERAARAARAVRCRRRVWAMTMEREDHDGADREVDACGEDDEGLGDGQGADDGDLLGDQGQVRRGEEAVVEEAEDDDRDDQHEGGADRRVAVQDVADPAERCRSVEEFARRGRLPGAGRLGVCGSRGLLLGWSVVYLGCGGAGRCGNAAPARLMGLGLTCPSRCRGVGGGDALDAVGRLVRHELDAGVEEVEPRRARRPGRSWRGHDGLARRVRPS